MPSTPAPSGNPMPGATCDGTKPFGAPMLVAGLPAGVHLSTPRLSSDELTMYFTTHVNGVARIARATRATGSAPFGTPVVLAAQSSQAKDNDPSVSADSTLLFFSSERTGSNDKLFFALASTPGEFGAPLQVGVGWSDSHDQHPYYRVAGGGELWFSSTRGGQWELWVAKRTTSGFAAAVRADELRNSEATRQPMITEDGLTIVFASERSGGMGMRDIWMARRTSTTAKFGTPEPLTSINSRANDYTGWLSPDGCRIYFSSDRETTDLHRVYVAARP